MSKSIVINKYLAEQLKAGKIITLESGGSFKLNNEGYIERVTGVSKSCSYSCVFLPNPQGVGMTTLTNDELNSWRDVSYGQMTIYRGDVKRNGEIVSRNAKDKSDRQYYLEHCAKIVIDGFTVNKEGLRVANIVSQDLNKNPTFKFTGEIYDYEIVENSNKAPKKL